MRETEGAKDKRVDKPAENEAARKREIHTRYQHPRVDEWDVVG
jgi:hypothetical protein